ncbi:protein kinase superfamily protein [Artemisia annua]|uniref:Protein kinase superfamily protein n=1 Tax=Artemisia annua TaxID=35608 RepID=A0A2U1LDV5_ARTAN|nr:protein kinase superfamily protein [Artemisia annua]
MLSEFSIVEPAFRQHSIENVEEPLLSVGVDKVNSDTPDGQGEGSDTNTGDTPFSLGRSPSQNGNSGVEKTSGTGGLGEGTPKIRPDRQTLYWSATWPKEIELLARQFLYNPYKDDIMDGSRILIFMDTKKGCDQITRQLRMHGWPTLSIHEDKTDVAARGLGDGLTVQRSRLQDRWDDAECYYSYRFRWYEVIFAHGKGVFSLESTHFLMGGMKICVNVSVHSYSILFWRTDTKIENGKETECVKITCVAWKEGPVEFSIGRKRLVPFSEHDIGIHFGVGGCAVLPKPMDPK